jgi:aspartokinase
MGEFVTGNMLVADARDYDRFSDQAATVMRQLVHEGRIPDTETVLEYIDLNRRLWSTCREQAETANSRGQQAFVARLPLSPAEYAMFASMGESLSALMNVIAMRGDLGLSPPEGAARFGEAVTAGTYHP